VKIKKRFKSIVIFALLTLLVTNCSDSNNSESSSSTSSESNEMNGGDKKVKCLRMFGGGDMSAWETAQADCMLNSSPSACECMQVLSN
jgi:hypothetical protein